MPGDQLRGFISVVRGRFIYGIISSGVQGIATTLDDAVRLVEDELQSAGAGSD